MILVISDQIAHVIERFPIECRKTKNQSMYDSQSDKGKKISSGVKENSW